MIQLMRFRDSWLVDGYMVLLTPDKKSKLNPRSLDSPIKWKHMLFDDPSCEVSYGDEPLNHRAVDYSFHEAAVFIPFNPDTLFFNDPTDEFSPHYGYSHLISTRFVDLSLHKVLLYFWSSSYIYSLLPFFLLDGCVDHMVTILEVKIGRFIRLISSVVSLYPLGLFGSCTAIWIYCRGLNEEGFFNLVYVASLVISLVVWAFVNFELDCTLFFVLAAIGS
ncbi:hypothetical protein H5410_021362 [Solanum commersonii]|uniref:Uncharacterized protein n=1 Tax=Solanum commersonii TaxID=4109 RepID=A0A9J5ZB45_SOLCO|nr:hypothetical protein H5410_021362 [Solanum commersonii]